MGYTRDNITYNALRWAAQLRIVNTRAQVNKELCNGCTICEKVCPTLSITVGKNRLAVVNELTCTGCGNCEERCPEYAISLVPIKPKLLQVDWTRAPRERVFEVCRKAHMHPQEVICYCTGTRAREIAASILLGARTPEKISRQTGVRTGCTVECIEPILRLLAAAGVKLGKAPGYQWYGLTSTAWDLPEEVVKNPEYKKFYFDEDRRLLDRIAESQGGE